MSSHEEDEIKKEFLLERIIFFSDAVFAIIITIMVLDVKLPDVVKYTSEAQAKNAFLQILPKLLAYIVTFAMVGSLWMKHLRVFSFLKDYNLQVVVLNLIFLLSISLYPFAESFLFSGGNLMQYSWGLYSYLSIFYFSIFTQTIMVGYLIRNKAALCINTSNMEMALRWNTLRVNYFVDPLIFVLITCTIKFGLDSRILWGVAIGKLALTRLLDFIYYRHYKDDKVSLVSMFRRVHPPQRVVKGRKKYS